MYQFYGLFMLISSLFQQLTNNQLILDYILPLPSAFDSRPLEDYCRMPHHHLHSRIKDHGSSRLQMDNWFALDILLSCQCNYLLIMVILMLEKKWREIWQLLFPSPGP